MNSNSENIRWLNEDGEALWLGFHEHRVVAIVVPGELLANQISEWQWRLVEYADKGVVTTSDDELRALIKAQATAGRAYFAAVGNA
jgi:hypothetical protein